MLVVHRSPLLAQLPPAALRWGVTVRLGDERPQLPENAAATVAPPSSLLARAARPAVPPPTHGGVFRRLQRTCHHVLARALPACACWASPCALRLLREAKRAFLRCPQPCLPVW